MNHFYLTLIILLSGFTAISAQDQPLIRDAITVNGLEVGKPYTRARLEEALGSPTRIVPPNESDAYPNSYTIYYGKDRFYWIDGVLYGFDLETSAFPVNGAIRVGDDVARTLALGGIRKQVKTDLNTLYEWQPSDRGIYEWLYASFYYDAQHRITSINAFIYDL